MERQRPTTAERVAHALRQELLEAQRQQEAHKLSGGALKGQWEDQDLPHEACPVALVVANTRWQAQARHSEARAQEAERRVDELLEKLRSQGSQQGTRAAAAAAERYTEKMLEHCRTQATHQEARAIAAERRSNNLRDQFKTEAATAE